MIEKVSSDICDAIPKKWHNAPQTIYSFFIMIALSWHKKRNINKSKLCKALMVAGTTLFFSIIAESLIIIELARHTDSLVNETLEEGSVEMSHLPMVQFVCITLFLVDMSNKFYDTVRNMLSIFSKEIKIDEVVYHIKVPSCSKAILVLCMLPDIATWSAVVVVGMKFLLVSTSTTAVIIDTLAINYIVDVDNMLFYSFVPAKIQDTLEGVQFSSNINHKTSKISARYNLYGHLPLIIIFSACVVYLNNGIKISSREYAIFSIIALSFLSIFSTFIVHKIKKKKKNKIIPKK
jgi:hypothetical protein